MNQLTRNQLTIKPVSICAYFDKIQVWFLVPHDVPTLSKLRKNCGKGGLFSENTPARFNSAYRQRVEFRQPNAWLLTWLSGQQCLVNGVEIALDFCFASLADRDDAYIFFHHHLVRRWHGRNQEIRTYCEEERRPARVAIDESETRYDAGRWAPNRVTTYLEAFCRITGELYCLHHEWRAKGARSVRSAGIESPGDLIGFDHRTFWEDRFMFVDIESKRIGALLRKRRRSRYGKEFDGKVGHIIRGSFGSMQKLLDEYGNRLRLGRIVRRLNHQQWLPSKG